MFIIENKTNCLKSCPKRLSNCMQCLLFSNLLVLSVSERSVFPEYLKAYTLKCIYLDHFSGEDKSEEVSTHFMRFAFKQYINNYQMHFC